MRQTAFVPAFAKINLTLDVLGRRTDGFHSLASVMQTVALHDTLALAPRDDDGVTFACDDAELENERNLALRAARLALSNSPGRRGVNVELAKRIPAQAGLGGGSSDAAASLVALNGLLRLGRDDAELSRIGATLGSDVPFFVMGGTALIGGRGEIITQLPDAEPLWLVLAKPRIGLSTAEVFGALGSEAWTDGEASTVVSAAIRAGEPLSFEWLANALEPGVLRTSPEVAEARQRLVDAGAPVARMSGSGPTLFAPFRRMADAAEVARRVADDSLLTWLTHTVSRSDVARAQRLPAWQEV